MSLIQPIIAFFNHPFFIIIGGLTVVLSIVAILYRIACWFLGITPVMLRVGSALWGKKIAILGSIAAFSSLKQTISGSKLFKDGNIIHIGPENIDKIKTHSLLLLDWESFGNHIDEVLLSRRDHQTAMVVYAKPGTIPPEKMADIGNRENTVVVNFRGRLLNDILTSLVTTSYAP